MLKPILDAARQIFLLTQETQHNKADIKEMRQEMKELRAELQRLTLIVQKLAFEIQRANENNTHERDKLLLQLRHEMADLQRRLPSSQDK